MTRKSVIVLLGIIALAIGIFIEPENKVGPWMDVVTIYTGAKFQNTGLPDQMRESCQKNSIRRKTKFFRVLPDRIITAGQGIAAFCSFTHFRSDRPWKHQRSRPILPG